MFPAILYTQWKWSRLPLLPVVIGAFTLPLLSVQAAGGPPELIDPTYLLQRVASWGVWFAALAGGLGLLVATTTWGADHRGGHAYALSLPVPRWKYVMMRFVAGLLLLLVAVAAFWVGSLIAAWLASVPLGLRTYPHALAMRFALAATVAYALFFAVSSGTVRTAAYVLTIIGGIVAVHVLLNAGGVEFNLIGAVFYGLADSPGVLHPFTGPWMLINV